MKLPAVTDYFSPSYQQAREKFLDVARQRSATLESFVHPALRGPAGEELAIDAAVLGDPASERVLMIVSGTHGVEGYAGSGCQVQLLSSELCTTSAQSLRIVLVHALNPYGFAHDRRTNEDNIDLNRNFIDFSAPLPVNPDYSEYAARFLPNGCTVADYQQAAEKLAAEARSRGGYQFLKKALQPGQYLYPDGLYYGGTGPCWSNTIFMEIFRRYGCAAQRLAVLDVHTGLGPHGVGELIFMKQEEAQKHTHRFSAPVSCAGGLTSVSAGVKGPLVSAASDEARGEMSICCALEFGTVPVGDNTQAMILENWARRCLAPDHPLFQQGRQRLRDTYYCDTAGWKESVIGRFGEIVGQLQRCLVNE